VLTGQTIHMVPRDPEIDANSVNIPQARVNQSCLICAAYPSPLTLSPRS
jgi:hypothetical protein